MNESKVWLVTGASKGLGLTLVKKLLAAGFNVAATSRSAESLQEAVQHADTSQFLPLQVELASEESVQAAMSSVISHFGKIDVVVNNAGYGQIGTFETLTDQEIRSNFDINVFSIMNVLRYAIPHMREKGSGHIFNISSIIGFSGGYAGWGCYGATKFAVTGMTESLAVEVKPLGLTATVVYPGYFRTNFLTSDSLAVSPASNSEYSEVQASLDLHTEVIAGNQPGDPAKAADVLIKVAASANPPLHLFLGEDAYTAAQEKIKEVTQALESTKSLTLSTTFEEQR
ncbi:SDR family oxidoreductase [Paenibacillus sp. 2TAB23]|uniref:SDR family oxidoreductase n=1 Tax=Paenibacillus sp. 2TAB23 TaxID=3233004 RepID=UPI003F947B31